MTNSDQQIIRRAAAKAMACLARTLEEVGAASPDSEMLIEALEAVESIEALADDARDAFAPNPSFVRAPPCMRPQRLALTRALLGYREVPELVQAA
jgi:hypothetical protein